MAAQDDLSNSIYDAVAASLTSGGNCIITKSQCLKGIDI